MKKAKAAGRNGRPRRTGVQRRRQSYFFPSTLLLLIPLCLAGCSHSNDSQATSSAARNIVLISIDTLRADHLSCYGYQLETSPNLDRLAASGALFRNAFSSSSWTVPAHATMMTGLDPMVHGALMYPGTGPLPPEYVTLAEILAARGFRTAAFTGGGYISPAYGFDQGFGTFVARGRRFEANLPAARSWVKKDSRQPFFLFLHGYNVHKPYAPPPPYNQTFSSGYDGDYDTIDFQPNNPRPSPEDLRFVISQYDGEIRYVDDLLGNFINYLGDRGILSNTVVIVTSDHGDEFYEHGNVDHIHTLYDELIRVPLIIAGPGIKPSLFHGQVGIIDILPTVLGLLGIKADEATQGYNLASFLRNGSDTFSHNIYSFTGFSEYPYQLFALRTPKWKFILWDLVGMKEARLDHDPERDLYTYKFRTDRQGNFIELYLLSEDRNEKRDLAPVYKKLRSVLSNRLANRLRSDKGLTRHEGNAAPSLGSKEIEALKALGYL